MKIGDYVRTKEGIITRIEKCRNGFNLLGTKETGTILDLEEWFKKDCIKSSPNIIDLIEENDILRLIDKNYDFEYISPVMLDDKDNLVVYDYEGNLVDIKQEYLFHIDFDMPNRIELLSIVTKEQFESIKYEVKE